MRDRERGVIPAPRAGGRVTVRRFAATDVDDFLAYQGHPLVRAHQPGPAMDPEEATRFVAEQAALRIDARGAWHGYVVEHLADRRVIGDVGVWLPAGGEPLAVADLGFQLDPRYHGRGYAREALEAFLPFAFRTFALDRVTASCDEANDASWRLLERTGMRLVQRSEGRRQYALDQAPAVHEPAAAPAVGRDHGAAD